MNEALDELHTTADKVNVEVIEEAKAGLFGLFSKKAKIRVTLCEAADKIGDIVGDTVNSIKEDYKAGKEEVVAAKKAETAAGAEVKTEKQSDAKMAGKNSVREYHISEEAVAAAKEFLQRIFTSMKLNVVIEKFVSKNDGTVTFKLHGDDMGILIGKHGQTLDSLQYLTNLVANKNSEEHLRIIVDIEDYRERRAETLTRLAIRLADKVKRTGERVALEPMSPHERKIIHMALQNDRRITTLSEGNDPNRCVVIELKK